MTLNYMLQIQLPLPTVTGSGQLKVMIFFSERDTLMIMMKKRWTGNWLEKWMMWTILGGIVFLGCQAWEWSHFISGSGKAGWGIDLTGNGVIDFVGANLAMNEYGPQLFADLFFFITGFHGTHVLSGVVLNVIIFYQAAMGTFERRGHYEMVEKVGLYWHFVDLVWVFVFTFFYLI